MRKMSSWKKENKMKLTLWYSLDKYKESDNYGDSIVKLVGEMYYVNTPLAGNFITIEDNDGKITSISRELVLKIEWDELPKWSILNENQVVESAKMRIKNLDYEIAQQKEQLEQQARLKETLDNNVGST
jgi:hypothetical protein